MRATTLLRVLLALLLIVGTLEACSNDEPVPVPAPVSTSAADLDGRTFLLQDAVGYTPVAGTVVVLAFSATYLGFDSGCSDHQSPYTLQDNTLLTPYGVGVGFGIDECTAELQAQDDWLIAFLSSSPALRLDGATLTLTSGDVVLTFLDREVADPDRPLVGPIWTIHMLLSGPSVPSPSTQVLPTLSFSSSGSFVLETGCNTGSGTYSVPRTDFMTFAGVTFTPSTCTDAASSTILEHLAQVFGDWTVWCRVEAAKLTIYRQELDIGITATANE